MLANLSYLVTPFMPNMRYCFVLLLVLFPHFIYAQPKGQVQIDSLQRALTDSKEDTSEVILLVKIDSLYNTIDPDRGINFGYQALDLCKILDWDRGRGLANMTIGLNYKYKAEYKRALPFLFTARTIFEGISDMFDLSNCLKNIGVVYEDSKEYDTALNYYRRSLGISEQLPNKTMIARNYGNICNLYESERLYDSALYYGYKSLRLFQLTGEKVFIATALGNIGIVYNSKGNYDSALNYDQQALKMFEDAGDKVGIAINLGNIASVYYAKDTARLAVGDSTRTDSSKAENIRLAIENYNKAISVANEINQIENIIDLEPKLADAYAFSGDYKAATECYKQYISTKDSAAKNEDITALATIVSNNDLRIRQQEAQIDQLKKQNQLTVLIASVVILIIIIVIVVNRFLAQLKSNRILAKEKKMHLEKIEAQATVLSDIAYTQSHDVRGEVATILGLAQIFNFNEPSDPNNKIVIEGIAEVTEKLDAIVKATIVKENDLSREDRITIVPNKNTLK